MGFALVRFRSENGSVSWGCVRGAEVFPFRASINSIQELLREDVAALVREARAGRSLEGLSLLSPVTAPCQIVCQGKNYRDHMLETGVSSKDHNLLFAKADSSLAPGVGVLRKPAEVKLLDYEVELGLVVGREINSPISIPEKEVGSWIAGLVIANDVSARDVQIPERQWFRGKSFRGFCPVGPYFYFMEAHDWDRFEELELSLQVNGAVRQKASVRQLMHKPGETLSLISRVFDLRAGDLLLTGTPGGVSMRVAPKARWEEIADVFLSDREKFARFVSAQEASGRYLRAGDRIEATITGGGIDLGRQELRVE